MKRFHLLFRAMLAAIEYHEPVATANLHRQLGTHSRTGCPVCQARE